MRHPTQRINKSLFGCAVVFLLLLMATAVYAVDIHVQSDCSLAEAIKAANNNRAIDNCAAGGQAADTIILTRSLWLRERLPSITSAIELDGNGHAITAGAFPAFVIEGGSLSLKNLHVRFSPARSALLLKSKNGALALNNTRFRDCRGHFEVINSSLSLHSGSQICEHDFELVQSWFGGHLPQPETCGALPGLTARATYGLSSGIQCQRVDAAGIGNPSIAAGSLDAVNVWGYVEQGAKVCFHQQGALVFLDASVLPDAVMPVAVSHSAGMTCAELNRPGTLVLRPAADAPPAAPAAGCLIHTTGHLRLRAQPSLKAEVLAFVPRGSTLPALARNSLWFQVRSGSQIGWIGQRYVDNSGNC